MSTLSLNFGTSTTRTISLNSLAAGNYVSSAVIDNTSTKPADLLATLSITPGTVGGNKQIVVFAIASADNSTWDTGNSSATDTLHDASMRLLAVIPTPVSSATEQLTFNVAQAFNGILPPYVQIIVKNDTGAALAASGHFLKTRDVTLVNA